MRESGLATSALARKKNCFSAHRAINAQIVNNVNAYSANGLSHIRSVGKQPETDASDFWKRLIEAWGKKGLPTSQNGIAMKLEMSQGSTRRWYTGQGLPETKVLRELAKQGDVTIDWLLDERLPKSPIGKQTTLGKFLLLWEQLDEAGKERIHRAALGEIALKTPARVQTSKKLGT
jgi:ribosome-binding protein aMBF1 (putative translation factor)